MRCQPKYVHIITLINRKITARPPEQATEIFSSETCYAILLRYRLS